MTGYSQRPLRIGLVGAGWVTQHHLAGWQALSGQAEVVAIADPNADAARQRAQAFGIAAVFDSAEHMFDATPLDAVDIAAPREFHAPLVRLAAARGLAVLCQKPLASTLDEARCLVADLDGRTRLMVHENWRFRPYYRDAEQWIREGAVGEIVQTQMTLYSSGLVPDAQGQLPALARQPFIATLSRALVTEILIHHIDALRFLLGDLALLHARLGRASPAMRGEDRAFLALQTRSGAPVSLMANLAVHGRPPALADRLTLVGTRGTIELESNALRCHGAQERELTYDMAAAYQQSYTGTLSHFVHCLANGLPFETNPIDNLKTLELVEHAYAGTSSG